MRYRYFRVLLLIAGDVFTLAGVLAFFTVVYAALGGKCEFSLYVKLWPVCFGFIAVNEMAKLYHGTMFYPGVAFGPAEELRRLFCSVTGIFLALFCVLFALKLSHYYSRAVFLFSWMTCIFAVPFVRWIVRSFIEKYNIGTIPAIIMGAGKTGVKAALMLNKNKYLGIKPIAFLDDDESKNKNEYAGIVVEGKLVESKRLAEIYKTDYVILCVPVHVIKTVIKEYCSCFKHILIIPDNSTFSSLWVYAYDIGGMLGLELRCRLMMKWPLRFKEWLDKLVALLLTLFIAPVGIIFAVLIKLTSRGPVFYRAERLGKGGQTFQAIKFRTMKQDEEKEFERLLEEQPALRMEWSACHKLKNDPRVTWIGRFLRRTSLDELPQLINVLRGEMSLIGPRPIVQEEIMRYGEHYDLIIKVKPGITGLWQVSGRSNTSYDERVDLDAYYIMNWNIWLDLFILLKTVKEVLFCRGAY
ncbi:MAG: undecaprenyl-phosphate galactose phosphotransferase WbaP [Victivallaceae bacterium]